MRAIPGGTKRRTLLSYILATALVAAFFSVTPASAAIKIFDVTDWGATGNGTTNDTTAIQNAINAAQTKGGTVYFPGGSYLIEGSGSQILLITKQVNLLGDGYASNLLVKSTVPTTRDVLRIAPPTSGLSNFGYSVSKLAITVQSGAPARHGIHIDVSASGSHLAKFNLEDSSIGGTSGRALYLSNPVNNDGFFTSVIQDNALRGGVFMQRAGDSLNFIGNTITGPNTGIEFDQVPGASHVVIAYNNITSAGGAIRLTAGGQQVKIAHNQIEQVGAYTGSEGAQVSINALATYPIPLVEITGNNMNALSVTGVANSIKVNNARSTRIRDNRLADVSGTNPHINVLSGAVDTEVGRDNMAVLYDVPVALRVSDTGSQTSGVTKQATLENGWVNYGSYFQTASYHKTADGMVYLRGFVKNAATPVPGQYILTLPVGFRPGAAERFSLDSNSATGLGVVEVYNNGGVAFSYGGNGYFSLSGISFYAEG